jgi:hypothetical protein
MVVLCVTMSVNNILLRHLKVKNVPIKHWSKTSGWEMVELLHGCVLAAHKGVVQCTRIISTSANEGTTIDNTSWVGVHVYAMRYGRECLIYFTCLVYLKVELWTT